MKKILLLSALAMVSHLSFAQTTIYQTVISKYDNFQAFTLESATDTDYLIENTPEKATTISNESDTLIFKRGIGKSKDALGYKEKKKFYLLNQTSDTISIYRADKELVQIGDQNYIRQETDEGWRYYNENEEKVCEVYISWNWSYWYYDLVFSDKHTTPELVQSIGICLKDMAHEKSAKDYQVEFIYIPIPLFE